MATRILGVAGKKRAGKDTIANYLVEQHGFVKMAFADAVREAALGLDPIVSAATIAGSLRTYRLSDFVRDQGWEQAKEHPEVRRSLQRMGTEAIRKLDEDFWLNVTMKKALAHGERVVISDVRFPNEAAEIQNYGMLIRVSRPGLTYTDTHVSEIALDDWPYDEVFENDGTIEDLRGKIDQWIR